MPPVPKKADWPKESRPVKPNRMSKPIPNRPQTRIRLMVVGVKPRCGSTNGTTSRPTAVSASMINGRCLSISWPGSFAAGGAEEAVGPQDQHQGHGREKHDIGVARIEHRG